MAYGTGRNAPLLHAVGRRFALRRRRRDRPPRCARTSRSPGLALFTGEGRATTNYQPQDIRFYPDHAAALADARWSDDEAARRARAPCSAVRCPP